LSEHKPDEKPARNLTREEYNMLLYRMEKVHHQKANEALQREKLEGLKKEAHLKAMQCEIANYKFTLVQEKTEEVEKAHEEFIAALSEACGHPIKGAAINPDTLEFVKI
jgi:hypothetical protein